LGFGTWWRRLPRVARFALTLGFEIQPRWGKETPGVPPGPAKAWEQGWQASCVFVDASSGLPLPPGVQRLQVLADDPRAGMVGAERGLEDRQGTFEVRPRPRQVPLPSQEEAQVVQAPGGVGMLGAQYLFIDRQGAFRVWPGAPSRRQPRASRRRSSSPRGSLTPGSRSSDRPARAERRSRNSIPGAGSCYPDAST
jgi:hypothetical protein